MADNEIPTAIDDEIIDGCAALLLGYMRLAGPAASTFIVASAPEHRRSGMLRASMWAVQHEVPLARAHPETARQFDAVMRAVDGLK